MPRFLYFLVLFFIFITAATTVIADDLPAQPTCDLCGWCNQDTNPNPPPNWNACSQCIYNGTEKISGKYYTVFGCIDTNASFFVKRILQYVFGIAGGIAFLSVLSGSIMILTSAGDPERLRNGKDLLTSSITGLLLIIFSVFLLRIVGYEIFRIPGFG